LKSRTVVERIAGYGIKPRVPHQRWIENVIDNEWCASLVAWTSAIGTYDVIIFDADGNRLRVTKAQRRRVATRAGVVVIQTEQAVMKSKPAQVSKLVVDLSTQPLFEG
jgi:hypothetical protein